MNILERRFTTLRQASGQLLVPVGLSIDARAVGDGEVKRIVGYTAVFGVETEILTWFGSFKEKIQKGAFRRALRENQDVVALRNHDEDNILGRTSSKTLKLKEDDIGLWVEIDTADTTVGRDTALLVERGDLSGMSFAFIIRKEKWINDDNGEPAVRIIQDVDLFDVGPVAFPAYEHTTADIKSRSLAHRSGYAQLGLTVPAMPDGEKHSTQVQVLEPITPEEEDEPVEVQVADEQKTTIVEVEVEVVAQAETKPEEEKVEEVPPVELDPEPEVVSEPSKVPEAIRARLLQVQARASV